MQHTRPTLQYPMMPLCSHLDSPITWSLQSVRMMEFPVF